MARSPVVVDISALQSSESRGRGIGHYALSWCIALESSRPDLVEAYGLNPHLPPPGDLRELLGSNKVTNLSSPLATSATIFHQLAPFDCSQPAGGLLPTRSRIQISSATVYDLIPARNPSEELIDPISRRRYRTRLELVRSLDHIQTISAGVAADLTAVLGIPPERITIVGAAPDLAFCPSPDRERTRDEIIAALASFGLDRPYVCYPSGSHPRKNNELVVRAFAMLPTEVRDRFQLVISGAFDAPTMHHLTQLAASLGAEKSIVMPGYLREHDLVSLIQGANLVVFASLAEGFGLPIVEALACSTPVIASAISPHDELLGSRDLFDPTDANAMRNALSEALTDPPQAIPGPVTTWEDVALRSAAAFDALLAARRSRIAPRSLRRKRPRLAVVSPLPPAPTGIARYSYRFIEALVATEKVDVTCFTDGPTTEQVAPAGLACHRVESLQHIERLAGRFDEVVYVFGNSHHHLGALDMLFRRRGLVMSHDVRLSNLYRHAHGDPGLIPGGLGREITRMYDGLLPSTLGAGGDLSDEDLERYGLLMARDVIGASAGFLVTSEAARELAAVDAQPDTVNRIEVLPFAIEAPRATEFDFVEPDSACPPILLAAPANLWGAAPPNDGLTYLAHFGIVDPVKRPELLIDVLNELRTREGLHLVFVGPVSATLCNELVERARLLKIEERVHFTGPLSPPDYLNWLSRAVLAIQLRGQSNGEASAAIGECLASGVATIVSNIGWSGELPQEVAEHVPVDIEPVALAERVSDLLDDWRRREGLSNAGPVHASHLSFDYAARRLLSAIASRTASDREVARSA